MFFLKISYFLGPVNFFVVLPLEAFLMGFLAIFLGLTGLTGFFWSFSGTAPGPFKASLSLALVGFTTSSERAAKICCLIDSLSRVLGLLLGLGALPAGGFVTRERPFNHCRALAVSS